jgi:uncharacterized protein (DUF1778 family)
MVRPKLPADERRSEVLQIRLTKSERASMEAGAKRAGIGLSEFIRDAALSQSPKPRRITR